jgi:histidinol dehydrogenase
VRRLVWNELRESERNAALARPEQRRDACVQEFVRGIVEDIRSGGWNALVRHSIELDGEAPRLVSVAPVAAEARSTLAPEDLEAIELAARNIALFHSGNRPAEHVVEVLPGLVVRKSWRALDRVGLYIPGGRTPLFSTLLMLAIPAREAGVGEIVVATPPRPQGGLDPLVALAADLCGIDSIWTVGGAQAIAALAFGAGNIPAVAKICGPGNAYVAEAKTYVTSLAGGPAIDLPAGPSELLVIADEDADPRLVAADLLSQAEHDPAAQVLLVTPSRSVLNRVEAQIGELVEGLPRQQIAAASLANARLILVDSLDRAVEIANLYAPEHLSLAVAEPEALVECVRNAGAVFAGYAAAETFGDYLAGSSHVLPTDGAARAWSGISVHSFLKSITIQQVTPDAASRIAKPAAALARLERLEAHALAADARLARQPA